MERQLLQVMEFQLAFNVDMPDYPKMLNKKRRRLRQDLLEEEVKELSEAKTMVDVADALTDIMYIAYGTIHEFGLADRATMLFDEVHRSNMSKIPFEGKPIYREDGKILKPDTYLPPKLNPIIERDFRVYKNSDLMKDIADIEKFHQVIVQEQNKAFEDSIKNKIKSKLNIIDRFLEFIYRSIEKRMKKRVEIKYPITAYDNVIINVYGKDYVI